MPRFRIPAFWLTVVSLTSAASGPALAHAGSIEAATSTPPVPTWFIAMTAGVVVGSSFLFTSLMADHDTLRLINGLGLRSAIPKVLVRVLRTGVQLPAFLVLIGIVVVGILGPTDPQANAATMLVWVGWWGGFTMVTYLIGNTWPLINPFRLLTVPLSDEGRLDLSSWGAWPAVVGLLGIVWLEVATGVSASPRRMAAVVVGYAALVVLGSVWLGRKQWFEIDPLSWIFRIYGKLAPVQRTSSGLELRLPGAALTDDDVPDTPGVPAFIVALLWATTFDGLVSTPAFQAVAVPVIEFGVPGSIVYFLVLLTGFGAFYGVYRAACRRSRASAETYVTSAAIERWLAPSLIPIAAGYHLAHFLGYVIALTPALAGALIAPLTGPASVTIWALPGWFGLLQLSFVLLGHLLAIWVAHSISFELFPGVR
ncbi:MAG: hypothetical protein ABEH64_10310, partial [Salinirussus sp.]